MIPEMIPETLTMHPIGIFTCPEQYPYDVPRQGVLAGDNLGCVTLYPGHGYGEGLRELQGFSHLWLLFYFNRHHAWRPLVRPPCHREHKVGVFASRSPYRPNGIGLSCVRLLRASGEVVWVTGHDLLDGTPVLDIKPYIPYADAHPEASSGWLQEATPRYAVGLSVLAEEQLGWLESRGVGCLRGFILDKLEHEPLNRRRHRLQDEPEGQESRLCYRTWRARFSCFEPLRQVTVSGIVSGYTPVQLGQGEDPYGDKVLHREFVRCWPEAGLSG